jgi:hypothetical protein
MTTKREVILAAYEELGLAEYNFDISPEEMASARKRLDRMMAEWEAKVTTGYMIPLDPDDSDENDECGVPDAIINAMAMNLAVRMGPSLGKVLSLETRVGAKNAYDGMLGFLAVIPSIKYPSTLPVGAGNKPLPGRREFFQERKDINTTRNGNTLDGDCGDPFTFNQ